MSSPPSPIHFWVYGSRATFQRSLEQLQRGSRKMKDVSVGVFQAIRSEELPRPPDTAHRATRMSCPFSVSVAMLGGDHLREPSRRARNVAALFATSAPLPEDVRMPDRIPDECQPSVAPTHRLRSPEKVRVTDRLWEVFGFGNIA